MKLRSFAVAGMIGAAVATASGQAFLKDLFDGVKTTSEDNLPTAVTIAKTWGNSAKDIAPDGVLSEDVTIPMDTVPPTTVQGLG